MDIDLSSPRTRLVLAAAGAVVLIAAVTGALLVGGGDGDDVDIGDERTTTAPTPSTETTEAPDRTTEPPDGGTGPGTTAPDSAGAPGPDGSALRFAVWPRPSSDVRFDDPVAAVASFARYYAHFGDPVIGGFRAGDSRSGEVPVRPRADGPETTVLVRQLEGDDWFVIGSITEDITVDEPVVGAAISCPLATSGRALAFEGTVQVRIDAYQPDGDRVEMGRGFVTGSGLPPAGPFSGTIGCSAPSGVEGHGLVTFWTEDESGETEGPWQFVTFPVELP